jgi:hypothetical protein
MASTKHWVPKVNRHCRVFVQKSVTNALGQVQPNYVKRRSVVVTGFASDTNPRLKNKRSGETHGSAGVGIVRQLDSTVPVGGDAAGETRLPGVAVRVVTGVGKYISQ